MNSTAKSRFHVTTIARTSSPCATATSTRAVIYPLMAISVGNPTGSWDPGDIQHRFPRVYTSTDGLRVNDEEEDCTLVIFKRSTSGKKTSFGKKGTSYLLRAKSRIERDECVFALNSAIEKLRYAERGREGG